jgi:hypothetical protein
VTRHDARLGLVLPAWLQLGGNEQRDGGGPRQAGMIARISAHDLSAPD